MTSRWIVTTIAMLEVIYGLRFAARLRGVDPAWRERFMVGFKARRRRRNHLIWASAAILLVGWIAENVAGGNADVDSLAFAVGFLCFVLAVATAWTVTGVAEHRWFRRDGAPRSFLALHAAATAALPIGLALMVALRLASRC